MAHKRIAIRKEIIKILKGKTLAGDRVFTNTSTPAWQEQLPVIHVYPDTENATEFAMAPRELKRVIDMRIECIAKGPEDPFADGCETVEDILDTMCEQIECELSRDDTINGTVDDIVLTSTDFQFEGEGSQPIGSARLIYAVTYHQAVPDSIDKQAGIEDFKTAHVDYHVGHDNEAPDLDNKEAEDNLDIPTA